MPKLSYGSEPENRVRQLLEALLDYADGELPDSRLSATLTVKWQEGDSATLAVETTLEDLRVLLYGKNKVPENVKKQQRNDIGELLTHYLGEFLQIWEDLRVKTRGSSRWSFRLKLWSKSKAKNLEKFQEEWRKRQPTNSAAGETVSIKVEVGAQGAISQPAAESARAKRAIALEAIPAVPVWVGRDDLVKQLTEKLLAPDTSLKVVALIGQGGIGKTSLSVKLLEALGVNLQPLSLTEGCIYDKVLYFKAQEGSSFDGVADFLLRGLGMETAEPLKQAEEKIAKILEGLTKARCLLVLDNLEVILHPASHPQAGRATSPDWGKLLNQLAYSNHRSRVILTSREVPADLADARVEDSEPDPDLVWVETVTGIEVVDGVRLLKQRQLKDSEEDLGWVSERVEGHVFLLTQLAAIARGKPGYLRKHPELVTKKAEPILQVQLARQSEAARDLLRRMCVLRVAIDIRGLTFLRLYTNDLKKDHRFWFASWIEKPAKLTDEEIEETQAIVDGLVDSSLVQCRYDEQQCEIFYDLHRLIVEYLQAKCQDELPQLLETVYKFYCTGKNVENPKTLEDLRPVLEAQYFAFQLGNYSEASRLVMGTLEEYLTRWGHWNLLKKLYEQILPHLDDEERPYCLSQIGRIHRDIGNWDEAERYFQNALAIAQEEDDKSGIATSLGLLGDIERFRGNWNEAERLYRQSLEIETELGDRKGMAYSWGVLGKIECNRGNWDEAERLYRQCLELMTELGDRKGMASSWGVLGDIERNRGNWDEAERLYRQSLQLKTELGDRSGMASIWALLGDIERNRGNWDEAERLYRQSLQLRTELGDRSGMAISIGCLGEIELLRGNLDAAAPLLREALARLQELGDPQTIAEVNYDLARLERQRGNAELAHQYFNTARQIFQQLGAAKDLEEIEREWEQD